MDAISFFFLNVQTTMNDQSPFCYAMTNLQMVSILFILITNETKGDRDIIQF